MPLTLHAAWLRFDQPFPDGNLFFWAENADFAVLDSAQAITANGGSTALREATNGAPKANSRQRVLKIPSHPSQVAVGQLRSLLLEEFPALITTEIRPINAEVWLPS